MNYRWLEGRHDEDRWGIGAVDVITAPFSRDLLLRCK